MGDQRAHRGRRRPQRRRDARAAAADALRRDDPPGPADRRGSSRARSTITGPFNIQFLARHNAVKVIECNLRASRSFPFVSKVTGENFVAEAMRRMLGVSRARSRTDSLDLDYVGVKAPMFSFSRLVGADPMLGVEMVSTGEVGCFGGDLHEALLHALLATGFRFPRKGVLLSLGPVPTSTGSPTRRASSPRSSSCPSTPRAAPPRCLPEKRSHARRSREPKPVLPGLMSLLRGWLI